MIVVVEYIDRMSTKTETPSFPRGGREAGGIVGPSWEEGTTRKHVRSDLRFVAEFSGVSRVSVDDPDNTNGI